MSHFESFYHSQGNFYSDHLFFVKIIKSVPLKALEECGPLPGVGDADGCRSSTRKRGIEVNDEEQVGFVEEILGNILQIAGEVLKDQDREAADGATTPLATTVTVGLAGVGSGRTSPPVLASATTTSYMASRKSQQPQGSQFHGVTNCIIQAYSRHLTCTCRQPCIGLCYLNKLRLSKGLSGIKWRRG